MNHIQEEFLRNELTWLKSLSCEIHSTENYIVVKSDFSQSEDFNFILPRKIVQEKDLYKVMDQYKIKYLKIATPTLIDLKLNPAMICLKTHDLNFKASAPLSNFRKLCNKKKGIWLSDSIPWKYSTPSNRFFSQNIVPFTICFNQYEIGQVCLVILNNNIGIYDLEIYKEFQKQGLGNNFLKELLSMNNESDIGNIFIQTWNENTIARRLYSSNGFNVVGKYRYYTYAEELYY
ncbi:GNAT family N-acetyltransferase [Enterococcus gallinarum]|nr:GNAT family N-acetyltransferase [Enterococcus gallinarum]